MKRVTIIFSVFLSLSFLAPTAIAANVEVKWTDPDKYVDIRSGNENRKGFRERTFKNLDKHFAKLAQSLPENQLLKIEVTDLDLAGDENIGGINRIRIIKEVYFPRIKFSYHLEGADKTTIIAGEINLKDMNFMLTNNLKYRRDSLGYEKKMLDDWFKKTFSEYIVEK